MSTHLLTHRSAILPALGRQVAARAAQALKAIVNRRSVHALYDYDERMLKDIGLTRSDITAALDSPLTDDPSQHLRQVAAGRGKIRRF